MDLQVELKRCEEIIKSQLCIIDATPDKLAPGPRWHVVVRPYWEYAEHIRFLLED
jgi:hypothetical protein